MLGLDLATCVVNVLCLCFVWQIHFQTRVQTQRCNFEYSNSLILLHYAWWCSVCLKCANNCKKRKMASAFTKINIGKCFRKNSSEFLFEAIWININIAYYFFIFCACISFLEYDNSFLLKNNYKYLQIWWTLQDLFIFLLTSQFPRAQNDIKGQHIFQISSNHNRETLKLKWKFASH